MESFVQFDAHKGETEIIPSHIVLLSRLKKCTLIGGTKIAQFRFFIPFLFAHKQPLRVEYRKQQ